MRTRLRTFILSAAFAIAAVSQAGAAYAAEYQLDPVAPIVQTSIGESIAAEAALNGVSSSVPTTELEASTSVDLAAVDVSVPLPEEISVQIVAELVSLAPAVTEDAPAAAAETVTIEVETTGSLPTSTPRQEGVSETVEVSTAVAAE